jgi:hypothetical protein
MERCVVRKRGKREARVQTGLRLEPEILDQLRKSPLGVSEEIRRRITLSLEADTEDPLTKQLADAVMWIADEVSRQAGVPWHSNQNARKALAVGIQTWFEIIAPPLLGAASGRWIMTAPASGEARVGVPGPTSIPFSTEASDKFGVDLIGVPDPTTLPFSTEASEKFRPGDPATLGRSIALQYERYKVEEGLRAERVQKSLKQVVGHLEEEVEENIDFRLKETKS